MFGIEKKIKDLIAQEVSKVIDTQIEYKIREVIQKEVKQNLKFELHELEKNKWYISIKWNGDLLERLELYSVLLDPDEICKIVANKLAK